MTCLLLELRMLSPSSISKASTETSTHGCLRSLGQRGKLRQGVSRQPKEVLLASPGFLGVACQP